MTASSPQLEKNLFFRRWLKKPLSLGAILPSSKTLSRFVARHVEKNIHEALKTGAFLVELGAGTGSFTQALLDAGIPPEQLIVVELDPCLFGYLKKRFPHLTAICGDAQNLKQLLPADLHAKIHTVVSSIPMVTLPRSVQQNILTASFQLLGDEGTFYQFTYSPFSSIATRKLALAKRRIGVVLRNVPPATVWAYRKAPDTRLETANHDLSPSATLGT